jgi:PAS domain S-box-containing protein
LSIERLKIDIKEVLLFLCEILNIPDAFIAFEEKGCGQFYIKVGLADLNDPNQINCFKKFTDENKNVEICDVLEQVPSHIIPNNLTDVNPIFFAGVPIQLSDFFKGSLCFLSKNHREFTAYELKIIKHSVTNIKSFLKIYQENQEIIRLKKFEREKFQIFENNSKEVLFQFNPDGVITYISQNWTTNFGHEKSAVIGQNLSTFIHVDDYEKFTSLLNTIAIDRTNESEILCRIIHPNGNFIWNSTRLQLVKGKEGAMPSYIGNILNISSHEETKQKIKEQKDFYETILNNLPTDVVVFDSNHKYIFVNPIAIKNEELRKFIIGKDDFEYTQHMQRDHSIANSRREKFLAALQKGETSFWEETLHSEIDGTTYHDRKFTPVFNNDGSFKMMIGFSVNITESKKIQEQILKNRQLTASILQNVAVGIVVQGPQSEIFENNIAACEMLGLTEDQLRGKTSFDADWKVIHTDGTPFQPNEHPVPQAIKKLKPINNIVMGVHRPIHNDLVWLMVDAIPVFGDRNELLYVICSFNDITAQKKAENSLKISNERFMYSGKATSDALWDWNMITDEMIVGEGYYSLFGHQFENDILTGQECQNFVHPEDREGCFASTEKAITTDVYRWTEEYRYLKSDGTYAFVKDKAVIIRNDEGKAIRMIGAMQDITKEKKLKDELQQSEEQFKGAFENSAVGMALINVDGYFIETNERLCEILGYSSQEIKCLKFQEITYYEDLTLDLYYKEQLDSGTISNFSSEKRYIHKNKSLIWVHISVSSAKNHKNEIKYYIVQIIDISERKKIEDENKVLTDEINRNKTVQLNEAKNLYRLLADNTVDLVCLHNLDGSFRYVSPSIQNLLGYAPEELIGKYPQDLVHPEDVQILKNNLHEFITEQEDVASQIRFKNNEGNYFWFETKAILVKENGIPINFQSSTRDITQRKEAEKIVENTLIRERELNELRTNLVSTISHEFRTPMTTIRTSAELMTIYIGNNNFNNADRLKNRAQIILEEIDRIVDLMNTVLIISKDDAGKTEFNPISFDLKQVCENIIKINYSDQKDERIVKFFFHGESFTIYADKNLIEYSLFNLLDNAFKYSAGFNDVICNIYSLNNSITLEIIDNGIGIPEEDQHKLFNNFFRASNTTGIPGTGLGLSIVKGFIEKNLGTIHLESKVGSGTKVTLQLPLHCDK